MNTYRPTTPRFFVPTLVLLLTATLAALACTGPDEEEVEERQYCELVSLWIATQGKHGWPDYNGNYNESCRDQK